MNKVKRNKIAWFCICAAMIGFLMWFSLFSQGCSHMPPNINVERIMIQETGFNLAFYALAQEPEVIRSRTEAAIMTALAMIDKENPSDMIDIIVDYIENQPQFRTRVDEYEKLIETAKRLLTRLLDFDLDVPEEIQEAREALRWFLSGALQGIEALRRDYG